MTWIFTERAPAELLFAAHQTGGAFTSIDVLTSAPEGSVATLVNTGKMTMCGVGDEDDTVQGILFGYDELISQDLFIPGDSLKVTATLGTKTAVLLGETVRFAKALAIVGGEGLGDSTTAVVPSLAGETGIAWISVDLLDWQFVLAQARVVAGATSANMFITTY